MGLKSLGKGSFGAWSKSLQIIKLNTLVDVIRVAKARTSCEYLPIDTNFCKHSVTCFRTFFADILVHTVKLKPIIKD